MSRVGGSHVFTYCGQCYIKSASGEGKPYGFCKPCWIKHGSPKAVKQ